MDNEWTEHVLWMDYKWWIASNFQNFQEKALTKFDTEQIQYTCKWYFHSGSSQFLHLIFK